MDRRCLRHAKRVYAMYAWACGGCRLGPALQSAPQPGTSRWVRMPTPPAMAIGPAQAATVFGRQQLHYPDRQLARRALALRRVSAPRRAITVFEFVRSLMLAFDVDLCVTAGRCLRAARGVCAAQPEPPGRLRPTPETAPCSARNSEPIPRPRQDTAARNARE
jgi:hypothetical protein